MADTASRIADTNIIMKDKTGKFSCPGSRWPHFLKTLALLVMTVSVFLLAGCQNGASKQEQKPAQIVKDGITFSHGSGFYDTADLNVHIKAPEGYTIAYTTNGLKPSAKDASGKSALDVTVNRSMSGYLLEHKEQMLCPEFSKSVLLEDAFLPAGVVLTTALVDKNGKVDDKVQKNVYFLQTDFARKFAGLLVISALTDQQNLLDYNTGILASGAAYDAWKKTGKAKEAIENQEWWQAETNSTQHGRKWERPVTVQFFTQGSAPGLETDAGLRVRGGMSRRQNQKSFGFYFRKDYGSDLLHFPLFEKHGEFKVIALRNGGNDSEYLKYKDACIQELAKGGKYTVMDTRPAILFLNGEYWGPYSLSEVVNSHAMKSYFGVEENNVVVIKEWDVSVGKKEDVRFYEDLQAFAMKDLSDPENYRQFCEVMDVEAMADYFAMRIYIGDADWSRVHNHILWRTKDKSYKGGRWQFILHDTEYSSGLYEERQTLPNTDHFALARKNFPVFAAAVKNKEFYNLFLASLKKMGTENFRFSRVRETMEKYDKVWEPLMPDFYKRFGDTAQLRKRARSSMLSFFQRRNMLIVPIVEQWRP